MKIGDPRPKQFLDRTSRSRVIIEGRLDRNVYDGYSDLKLLDRTEKDPIFMIRRRMTN